MELKGIINKLQSDGALYRCQGILAAIKERANDPQIIKLIQAMKEDHVVILGREVSAYAIAALDILGAEKYAGEDFLIKDFIKNLPMLAQTI